MASVHMMREQFENGQDSDGNKLVAMFHASTRIPRVNQLHSESVECFAFIVHKGSYDAVFRICMLEFHFQNLFLLKSTVFKIYFCQNLQF